ncbi:MAG: PAS domain-containing sensor histidine kinase [bacterium]
MKYFQKQLIFSLIFFAIVFGLTVYFAYRGIHNTTDILSEESAFLLVTQFKPLLESGLKGIDLNKTLPVSEEVRLRQLLLRESKKYSGIEDVLLTGSGDEIIFSLNSKTEGSVYETDAATEESNGNNLAGIQLIKTKEPGTYDAVWAIVGGNDFKTVLRINTGSENLRRIIHNLTLKFYLIGFAGVLGVIVVSLVSARLLKAPMKEIERAMTNIDKRKYGYRLKAKSNSEFAGVYQKVNLALRRLEQLDAVERTAVQKRNAILKELKTISRFLDIMAHEIKNPLHAMGINLDVLKTKLQKGQSKETALKHADILEQELDHLQEVVRGFLSYVRPGVPQKQRTNLNNIIKEVCQMAAAEADKSKISIETRLGRGLRDVLLDRAQIQQALHNIVINAIQATREGGKVMIRSWPKRKKALLSIRDTGAGISREHLKKIFDLYFTTKKGGTGLGLPITKRIVEANGGQMQLESKLGRGTTVTIMFPTI